MYSCVLRLVHISPKISTSTRDETTTSSTTHVLLTEKLRLEFALDGCYIHLPKSNEQNTYEFCTLCWLSGNMKQHISIMLLLATSRGYTTTTPSTTHVLLTEKLRLEFALDGYYIHLPKSNEQNTYEFCSKYWQSGNMKQRISIMWLLEMSRS